MHKAFHAGVNTCGDASEELVIDLFYWLKSSPSRREDYIHVLSDLGLDEDFLSGMYNVGGSHLFLH